jgi:hypothetical protein
MASVRIDLLALITASAAPRTSDRQPGRLGDAVHDPRTERDPGFLGFAACPPSG